MKLSIVGVLLWCAVVSATDCRAEGGTTGAAKGNNGCLSGKVLMRNGTPMAGASLLLFKEGGPPPQHSKYWRTPDETAEIGPDGAFKACLAAGRYYLAAVKRSSHDLIGPPVEGDLVYPESRADIKKEQQSYLVRNGEVTDAGVLADGVVFRKLAVAADVTAVEGTVVDTAGNPVKGAVVCGYLQPDLIGKPLFVSERTGSDGKFQLRVAKGSYYLKARTSLSGGKPKEGEVIGVFGEGLPEQVILNAGETITGIRITGRKFVNQQRKRKEEARSLSEDAGPE